MALSLLLSLVLGSGGPGDASPADDAGQWIATRCVRDAALTVRPGGDAVSGYFGNITAAGLVAARVRLNVVNDWLVWYILNAHGSGSGVDGVPDDGHYIGGSFVSRGRPDSTDAYGATFISLANAAYDTADPALRATILAHRPDLERIARSMLATLQADGLTMSRPQHPFSYAIDNEQVYRGLLDAASLWSSAYRDSAESAAFRSEAARLRAAIERVLWDERTQSYRPVVDAAGRGAPADLSRAYPDALAQVFAVVYGVVDPKGSRASRLIDRSSPALLDPSRGDATEYRELVSIARNLNAGMAPARLPFDPPTLCSDAGWYLVEQASNVDP